MHRKKFNTKIEILEVLYYKRAINFNQNDEKPIFDYRLLNNT